MNDSGSPQIGESVSLGLSAMPEIMSTEDLAKALGISADALAQDRYRYSGTTDCIPYVKINRRVRYLRADVVRFLAAHRIGSHEDTRRP